MGTLPCWVGQVSRDHPQHQRQAHADRERHGQPGDVDRRHQQDVRQVENHAAQERRAEPFAVGLLQVGQEAAPAGARAAHREGQQQRQQQHADRVVPVEKLEPPFLGGQLLRVRPRSPAQHRDDAHDDRDGIRFNNDHVSILLVWWFNGCVEFQLVGASRRLTDSRITSVVGSRMPPLVCRCGDWI